VEAGAQAAKSRADDGHASEPELFHMKNQSRQEESLPVKWKRFNQNTCL
jgi:hypothetical protein